jgi:glycosyltransferase involved in cell wall biosynthesis
MHKPLKIAHLTPAIFSKDSYLGGGERYVYNIADAIARAALTQGLQIDQKIISVGPDPHRFYRENIEVIVLENISHIPRDVNSFSDRFWDVLKDFDLVHIHQSLTIFGAYCTAIVKSLGIPIVTTDHGGGSEEVMLKGRGIELSDGVLSVSKYALSLIGANYYGLSRVVIGPIDSEFFKPNNLIQRNKNSILSVNRIMPHKGIDRIIEALPKELELKVVGQIYNKKYYKHLRSIAGGKNVVFVSDVDDTQLVELYQTSGLFIQASTHIDCYGKKHLKPELMGLTTLEAMSCGAPVIVSDAGSLPELLNSEKIGRVFSNKTDLEKIFKEYVSGEWPPADQENLSRKKAVDFHSYINVGNRVIKFYSEVLKLSRAI